MKIPRCRPLSGTWRCYDAERGIEETAILAYLTTPPGAQIKLGLLWGEDALV